MKSIENCKSRKGFTLVELLVVISIIGILVGLTMPAVMSAIESGRRVKCANNLRQVALATCAYESQQRQFPLNWGQSKTPAPPDGTPTSPVNSASSVGVSWLASLLPYMDSSSLYNEVMFPSSGSPTVNLAYTDANGYNNLAVLKTPVPTFLCPSDTQNGTISGQALTGASSPYATTNYKACAGSNWKAYSSGGFSILAITATAGRAKTSGGNPADGIDNGNGVICRNGMTSTPPFPSGGPPSAPYLTAMADIRDGASTTILCGESVPAWCGWSLWFWFDGSTATCGIPLNFTSGNVPSVYVNGVLNKYAVPNVPPESDSGTWQACYGFMSRHKLGANFAACDGAVHFVPNAIDFAVYQALATIDGNEAQVVSATDGVTVLPVAWP